jgi:hypothetical protein
MPSNFNENDQQDMSSPEADYKSFMSLLGKLVPVIFMMIKTRPDVAFLPLLSTKWLQRHKQTEKDFMALVRIVRE